MSEDKRKELKELGYDIDAIFEAANNPRVQEAFKRSNVQLQDVVFEPASEEDKTRFSELMYNTLTKKKKRTRKKKS